MKPILSKFETNYASNHQGDRINPLDDVTLLDKVAKYSLLQPDISIQVDTKQTFIDRETTDDS